MSLRGTWWRFVEKHLHPTLPVSEALLAGWRARGAYSGLSGPKILEAYLGRCILHLIEVDAVSYDNTSCPLEINEWGGFCL
jgi:hypothetical protein